jgi:hypothetical protein
VVDECGGLFQEDYLPRRLLGFDHFHLFDGSEVEESREMPHLSQPCGNYHSSLEAA